MHRHVQLVVVGVLEQQELGRHAADVHRHEAAIAADAVVLMHDRGAGTQISKLLDDPCRVAIRAFAAPLLLRAFAEELFLGDDGETEIRQRQAGCQRRDGDSERHG